MRRSSLTECCVGFVFSSPAASMNGTSVTWRYMTFSAPTSRRNWRIASRNGSDSMSPTVPPISLMTTSVGDARRSRRMRDLISFVMCGMTWTVAPRYSPLRSLRSTESQIAPAVWLAVAREVLVDEALVVADVEVGLGAVLRHEHLAVLERAHRPRVDVEVRVELLRLNLQASRLQQPAERRGDDPLAERRHDAAGDEDVLRRARAHGRRPRRRARDDRRALDQLTERGSLAEDGEAREGADRYPPASSRDRFTEFNPSSAPSAFDPASPSIAISRRS